MLGVVVVRRHGWCWMVRRVVVGLVVRRDVVVRMGVVVVVRGAAVVRYLRKRVRRGCVRVMVGEAVVVVVVWEELKVGDGDWRWRWKSAEDFLSGGLSGEPRASSSGCLNN